MTDGRHIVVAITGASGAIYADQLLRALAGWDDPHKRLSLVVSTQGEAVWNHELGDTPFPEVFRRYAPDNFFAPFASGTSRADALVVCPCSMGTLGRIAGGISGNLITRAADVMLKERRRLILVVRDTPCNLVHLRNMTTITEAGGIVCPASPSYYSHPQSVEAVALTVTQRVLDLLDVPAAGCRWTGEMREN